VQRRSLPGVEPACLIGLALLVGCGLSRTSSLDGDLLRAANRGNTPGVTTALQQGADANAHGQQGWTALMMAARAGDVDAVQALIQRGAFVNASDDLGETALMVCHPRVVPTLVAAGARIEARDRTGETALMKATDIEKTRALLAAGADANARSEQFGPAWGTVLMTAARAGDEARAQALLAAGGDPKADVNGYTVLMAAAASGTPETVRLLLQQGAPVDPANDAGRTALHFAAMNLRRGVVEEILAAHPEVNRQAADGSTPLLLAAKDGYVSNVRALLAAGADPQIANTAGQTPLAWARARKDDDVIALLQAAGARAPAQGGPTLRELKRAQHAADAGGLEVFTTDLVTDGRFAKIRGSVRNRLSEPVEGVRYVIRLFSGDGARLLQTLHYDTDTTIAPGDTTPLRLDVESMYFATGPLVLIEAAPKRVGGRDRPKHCRSDH
jgi:ankyrin repeat protein